MGCLLSWGPGCGALWVLERGAQLSRCLGSWIVAQLRLGARVAAPEV